MPEKMLALSLKAEIVGAREGVARAKVQALVKNIVGQARALDLGVLVAKLAFKPEHAEIVACVEVDVIADLVADTGEAGRREIRAKRVDEVDRAKDVIASWEQNAGVDAGILRAVAGRGWRRDRNGRCRRKQEIYA